MKIKNLVSGLRSVDLKAKVIRIFEPREFEKEGKGVVITEKPITPEVAEIMKNPRSRSAKMRIFEKNEKFKKSDR